MRLTDFIDPRFRYAVVGATTNRAKYGYRVLKDLRDGGFDVVGVNSKYAEIEGIPCFPSLSELPRRPDVAIFVIPPAAAPPVLEEAKRLGIEKVWFQPGAESDDVLARCRTWNILTNDPGSCIMVDRRGMEE